MNENRLLLLILAGLINKNYLEIIEFLNEEIRVVKEMMNDKRFQFNNDQRRRLAKKFRDLDRKLAEQQELLVTPETFMLWYKKLIAKKWDYSEKVDKKKRGRPRIPKETVALVLKMIEENPNWGDEAISDRLSNIGIICSSSSIGNIRKDNGMPPAKLRNKTGKWEVFIKANWETLTAIDFTTVEVLNKKTLRLETYYLLFAIKLSTREVHLCGIH